MCPIPVCARDRWLTSAAKQHISWKWQWFKFFICNIMSNLLARSFVSKDIFCFFFFVSLSWKMNHQWTFFTFPLQREGFNVWRLRRWDQLRPCGSHWYPPPRLKQLREQLLPDRKAGVTSQPTRSYFCNMGGYDLGGYYSFYLELLLNDRFLQLLLSVRI